MSYRLRLSRRNRRYSSSIGDEPFVARWAFCIGQKFWTDFGGDDLAENRPEQNVAFSKGCFGGCPIWRKIRQLKFVNNFNDLADWRIVYPKGYGWRPLLAGRLAFSKPGR